MPSAVSETMRGSSPLARGLPAIISSVVMMRRIIPARAGFTPPRGMRCRAPRDHPRSRGVYVVNWLVYTAWPGSSPLARGLRLQTGVVRTRKRIIPARAGFTTDAGGRRRGWRDHPRSRGVYHHELRHGQAADRIIPARAGFTSRRPPTEAPTRDHPRSRGVYNLLLMVIMLTLGSSPLARGLHRVGRRIRRRSRIIPARAGFTVREVLDFPRERIIPARAGFTGG